MSAITTLAPVLANATAVERPMPLEPPVISTTLSSKADTFITSSSCLELFLGSALDGVEPKILHLRPAHCGFQDPHPGHHALLRGPVHLRTPCWVSGVTNIPIVHVWALRRMGQELD